MQVFSDFWWIGIVGDIYQQEDMHQLELTASMNMFVLGALKSNLSVLKFFRAVVECEDWYVLFS